MSLRRSRWPAITQLVGVAAIRQAFRDLPTAEHPPLWEIVLAGANLVGVEHRREGVAVHLGEVEVALQVETRGAEHITDLINQLASAGYSLERL